ncbi:hypothetical protein MBENS4_1840 [Novosphingobium sp. MBES04]|nr:hypothetical protein MBENS4_1840 [Novosphingobium sp. MBES04]
MNRSLEQEVERLREQVYALQQLLLAQVVAFDHVDRQATDSALDNARIQSASMVGNNRAHAAHRLDGLIKAVLDSRQG